MLCKLTDKHGRTRAGKINETQWGTGVTHSAQGAPDQPLCTNGWIHAYEHPLIAVIMNPIHAAIETPKLWESRGEIGERDGQLKCGCRTLTTIREILLPKISIDQLIRFAIGIGMLSWNDFSYHQWASNWLNGKDRTVAAAWTAAEVAWAAGAAAAARAALVAKAATRTVWTAAEVAWAAEATAVDFDLFTIAEWAMTEESFAQLKKRMKGKKK